MSQNISHLNDEDKAFELTRDYLKASFKFEDGAPEDFAKAYKAVYLVILNELMDKNNNVELSDLKDFFNR